MRSLACFLDARRGLGPGQIGGSNNTRFTLGLSGPVRPETPWIREDFQGVSRAQNGPSVYGLSSQPIRLGLLHPKPGDCVSIRQSSPQKVGGAVLIEIAGRNEV